MQIRPNALTIGLIIYFSIALFFVYTEFGIDSLVHWSDSSIAISFKVDILSARLKSFLIAEQEDFSV